MKRFIDARIESACRNCEDLSFYVPLSEDVTKNDTLLQYIQDIGGKLEFVLPNTLIVDAMLGRYDMDGENDWFRLLGMVYINAGKITLSHIHDGKVQVEISYSLEDMRNKKRRWEADLKEVETSRLSPGYKAELTKHLTKHIENFQRIIDKKEERQ